MQPSPDSFPELTSQGTPLCWQPAGILIKTSCTASTVTQAQRHLSTVKRHNCGTLLSTATQKLQHPPQAAASPKLGLLQSFGVPSVRAFLGNAMKTSPWPLIEYLSFRWMKNKFNFHRPSNENTFCPVQNANSDQISLTVSPYAKYI